ncbi:uncharacterized protein SCHCODRAFT_02640807 [Schizophyllum commune H4-8]|uniref:uncharacterized protein n=1 Tax=Schizophyllum commune (strain H4-8 / FGSC 9210) TaxID=578458 RepID=UPI00215F8C05|nr:uncharacterized protein SCHCODRAFT_02640807 [Schizophyllum commune H4-8]KAI5887133.1 hypothetical protein SCHCODRAFT_02640807 [Schizophyllum commune H4-8]
MQHVFRAISGRPYHIIPAKNVDAVHPVRAVRNLWLTGILPNPEDGRLCLSFFGTRAGGWWQLWHTPDACCSGPSASQSRHAVHGSLGNVQTGKYTPLFMNVVCSAQHSPRLSTLRCACPVRADRVPTRPDILGPLIDSASALEPSAREGRYGLAVQRVPGRHRCLHGVMNLLMDCSSMCLQVVIEERSESVDH